MTTKTKTEVIRAALTELDALDAFLLDMREHLGAGRTRSAIGAHSYVPYHTKRLDVLVRTLTILDGLAGAQ